MEAVAVVVMAKAPRTGEVKTRLCPPLSPAEAAELYRCFLLDTIARVNSLKGVRPVIAYTPASSKRFFRTMAPGFTLLLQQGDDLGSRMAACLASLFAQGHTSILLTGSDLPTLPAAYLQQAVALLATPDIDVVLGPSTDGGYYLIGLRQLYRELFENMAWSTDQVLTETVRRAEARGCKVACIPPWFDIDTAADLERLQAAVYQTPYGAPRHTRRFFLGRTG